MGAFWLWFSRAVGRDDRPLAFALAVDYNSAAFLVYYPLSVLLFASLGGWQGRLVGASLAAIAPLGWLLKDVLKWPKNRVDYVVRDFGPEGPMAFTGFASKGSRKGQPPRQRMRSGRDRLAGAFRRRSRKLC